MSRSLSRMLLLMIAGQATVLAGQAVGQGVGPAKPVKLVFLGFHDVDVDLWIDGKRVVSKHMTTVDQSTGESLITDGKVRQRSKLVLVVGHQRKEATVASIGRLKTIYMGPNAPIRFSSSPPALD